MKRREFIASLLFTAVTPNVQAQQPDKVYRLALVHPSVPVKEMNETSSFPRYRALFGELRRLGYIEGQNLTVARYSGEGQTARYPELVREVVRQQPDVILAASNRMIQYFKAATATIPIVGFMDNPVAHGFVSSMARPGGNITGFTSDPGFEIGGKRLGLLRELIPTASRIGFLSKGGDMRAAAQKLGISFVGPPLEGIIDEAEYRRVFTVLTEERADALIVDDLAENNAYSRLIIELAEKSRLPAIFPYRDFAALGGLIAYGIDTVDLNRRAAGYIARILQGAKPSELPIDNATKIELGINLKTAKSLGLTVPQILLAGADEIIE
jgi:putative tryptophan/tyrosine transport system substrate-binding protein